MNTAIRILFNDSRNNYPGTHLNPQGGPGVFATHFTQYFKKTPHHLISLFFSNDPERESVAFKIILSKKQHTYVDFLYRASALTKTYIGDYTKKEYLAVLSPWLEQLSVMLEQTMPDVVFLNGYSLTNYMLFAAAKKNGIPVCIQHAGIWKEELLNSSGNSFSPSVRRIFISFEKELTKYATYHVFLNDHSKQHFLNAHRLQEKDLHAVSVIPLPMAAPRSVRPVTLARTLSKPLAIAAVSRWDAIKNHSALLRLAEYIDQKKINATVSVVTNPFNNVASAFRDRYTKHIQVVAPMSPAKLVSFYRTCDVLILPSKFETVGGVVMEALMQGVPAIISDKTGWVQEYADAGLTELIISPNSSGKQIYDAIDILFSHPERFLKKFALLQKRIVRTHLSKDILPHYETIFINLSKKHHG